MTDPDGMRDFEIKPVDADLPNEQSLQETEGGDAGPGDPGREPVADSGSRTGLWVVLLVVALVSLLLGLWGLQAWRGGSDPVVADDVPPMSEPEQAPADPEPRPERASDVASDPLSDVTLDLSDAVLRPLIAALSSHPQLAEWLVPDDLVRRFVKVVANVAYDEDPRVHVPFMRPAEPFETAPTPTGLTISSASTARYDLITDVFVSLDPEGSAKLYARLEGLIEQAHRELGYPGSFRNTLDRAVARVREVPVLDTPPELTASVLSYHFADPELEALPDTAKLLIRFGPDNQRRIQEHLGRLMRALELADSAEA